MMNFHWYGQFICAIGSSYSHIDLQDFNEGYPWTGNLFQTPPHSSEY